MNRFIAGQTTPKLVTAIMGIHTGETLVPATPDLTYPERQTMGQPLLKRLAEDMIRHYEIVSIREIDYSKIKTDQDVDFWQRLRKIKHPAEAILEQLKANLEMDGYVYQEGHLYPSESAIIDTVEERTALERLLDLVAIREKAVIKHHIQDSEKAYAEQRWGHSISDARNVLEAILREVAAAHYLKTKGTAIPDGIYKWAAKVRDYLLSESLIDKSEQEALRAYQQHWFTSKHRRERPSKINEIPFVNV